MIEKVFLWIVNFDPGPREVLEYFLALLVWGSSLLLAWTWKKRRK